MVATLTPIETDLVPLLDFLQTQPGEQPVNWHDWHISRITGGQNNILYRATNLQHDLAVKFTRRDERDRAGREHNTLRALHRLGWNIAPQPLYLNRERFAQPVVVTTWVHGTIDPSPPATAEAWTALMCHFATIHTVLPAMVAEVLPHAVVNFTCADDGLRRIDNGFQQIPVAGREPQLVTLIDHIQHMTLPVWPTPPLRLCRTDPNTTNLIRRPGHWASVDWENSGWGDPAFEIADLMAHPAYITVTLEVWQQVVDTYARLHGDPAVGERIWTYYLLMLADWAVFFARKRYELANGVPQKARLVQRPAGWAESVPYSSRRYLELATTMLVRYEQ